MGIRSHLLMAAVALTATFGVAAGSANAALDPKALTQVPFDQYKFEGKPGGPQQVKVYGDPDKPGPYGILIRWLPHTNSRPHLHHNDRYIVVLQGVWWVNTGPKFNAATMVPIKPGVMVTHHKDEIHYDGAKDEGALIWITGMGPATSVDKEQK